MHVPQIFCTIIVIKHSTVNIIPISIGEIFLNKTKYQPIEYYIQNDAYKC